MNISPPQKKKKKLLTKHKYVIYFKIFTLCFLSEVTYFQIVISSECSFVKYINLLTFIKLFNEQVFFR